MNQDIHIDGGARKYGARRRALPVVTQAFMGLCGCSLLAPQLSWAQTEWSTAAEADAYIRTDLNVRRNDNYGCDPYFIVGTSRGGGGKPTGGADAMRAMLRFNLSEFPFSGDRVGRATLELSLFEDPNDGPNSGSFDHGSANSVYEVGAYRIVDSGPLTPWNEGNGREYPHTDWPAGCVHPDRALGVAWDGEMPGAENNETQPAFDPGAVAVAAVSQATARAGDRIFLDVTDLVRDWVDGAAPNHGLLLRDITSDGIFRGLRMSARESGTPAMLRIELEDRVDCPDYFEVPLDETCHWTADSELLAAACTQPESEVLECNASVPSGVEYSIVGAWVACESVDGPMGSDFAGLVPRDHIAAEIVVGRRQAPAYVLRNEWVHNWSLIEDVCQLTWTDNCTPDYAIVHGIIDVRATDPNEEIQGQPGYFHGTGGMVADWYGFQLNLDRNLGARPRGYVFTFAAIDGSGNGTTAECAINVVEPDTILESGTILETDTSWRTSTEQIVVCEHATINDPGPAWTRLDYDDDHWHDSVHADLHCGGNLPDVTEIWAPNRPNEAFFRKTFDLDRVPSAVVVEASADDNFQMYVNGVLVDQDRDGGVGDPHTVDITHVVQPGKNLLAFRAWDSFGGCDVSRRVCVSLGARVTME